MTFSESVRRHWIAAWQVSTNSWTIIRTVLYKHELASLKMSVKILNNWLCTWRVEETGFFIDRYHILDWSMSAVLHKFPDNMDSQQSLNIWGRWRQSVTATLRSSLVRQEDQASGCGEFDSLRSSARFLRVWTISDSSLRTWFNVKWKCIGDFHIQSVLLEPPYILSQHKTERFSCRVLETDSVLRAEMRRQMLCPMIHL